MNVNLSSKPNLSQALNLLEQVGDAANFEPVKIFAGVAGVIIRICESASSNKAECLSLGNSVVSLIMAVHDIVSENQHDLGQFLFEEISALSSQLEQVRCNLEELTNQSSVAWLSRHSQDSLILQRLQRDVIHCREVFLFQVSVDIDHTIARLAGAVSRRREILSKIQEVRQTALNDIVHRLSSEIPHAEARLPAPPTRFFGRQAEAVSIISTLESQRNGHVAILGPPGIGKTTLTLHVLHDQQMKSRFADRRYFISCEGIHSKDDLLSAIAGQLGLYGDGLQKKTLDKLNEKETILVLDNFETPFEAYRPAPSKTSVEQLLISITALPFLSLLLTMRGAERPYTSVKWARPFLPPLQPLGPNDCRQLFLAWSNCAEDDPDIDPLLSLLDGVPLAVTLMATFAQIDSAATLIQRWQSESTSLLQRGADRRSSLDISIKISIQSPRMQAVPAAQELLSLISLLPDGLENRKIRVIFPDVTDSRRALSALWQTALAFNDGHGRTRILSPIRAYMSLHHNPTVKLRPMIVYYMGLASLSSELGGVHGKNIKHQLTPDLWNIQSAVRLALLARYEEPDESFLTSAIQASIDLSKFLRYVGLEAEILQRALVSSGNLVNKQLQADVLFHLAWDKCLSASRLEAEEFCTRANFLYDQAANLRGQAECAWLMGQIRKDTDRQTGCEPFYRRGLTLSRQAGDKYCQAKCLSNLAEIAFYCGNVDASVEQSREALALFRDVNHLTNIGMTLYWMGRISSSQSRHAEALAYYEEAAEFLEKAGAHQLVGRILNGRGDVSFSRCDFISARTDYQRAIDNYREDGTLNNSGAAYSYLSLGETAAALSELDLARQCLQSAYQIFEKRASTHGKLHCHILYGDLALAAENNPQYTKADEYYRKALDGARCAGFSDEMAIVNGRLGQSCSRQRRAQSAEQYFVIAMALYRRMRNLKGIGSTLAKFAECLLENNERTFALSSFYAALPLCRRFEAVRDVAGCLLGIGHIIDSPDLRRQAMDLYETTGKGVKVGR